MVDNAARPNGASCLEQSCAEIPLKVVIVGAGIAGLVAAIGLRNHGHQVFEQSQFADEIGAAIHISPNANSVLQKLGVDVAERGAPKLIQTRYFDSSCNLLFSDDNEAQSHQWQVSWRQAHRGHLHTQLKDRATSTKHEGTPIILHTSSRITKVDAQNATITLTNGDTVHGDALIGADGVRSTTRRAVAGPEHDSFEIGKSAIRFMVPREAVLADAETRELAEVTGSMDLIFAKDHKVIIYQCVNNTLLNIVCIHPSFQSDASVETYNKSVSKEQLLDIFHGFAPKLLKLFAKCDSETLKVYPLFDAVSMPTFIKDRLALIGDAAHPFTPFIGQGGATAIEDGVSIGVILSRGTTTAEVPEMLRLYNTTRYERATRIQGYSRTAGGDGIKPGEEKAARMKGREHAFYALSHDEFHASTQALREYKWSKLEKAIWRHPTVFGPSAGPRGHDTNYTGKKVRTVTARITFKTSATLLRNMLPNSSYSFASKATVALASVTIQSFRKVEWLGGRGFNRVSLEIHGINYTKADGSVASGRYVPVVFENSADVISAEREEMGYPSVFSDIEVKETEDGSFLTNLSWDGCQCATIYLKDLTLSAAPEPSHEGVFVHKCTASLASGTAKGENYIRHDILIEEESGIDHVQSNGSLNNGPLVSKASLHAGFEFIPHNQKELPTLHHIVDRLGELSIFEVVAATVIEADGSDKVLKASAIS